MSIITNYDSQKTALRAALRNDFAIPAAIHAELKEYKLLYWSVSYLLNQVTFIDSKTCLLSTNHGRYYECNLKPSNLELLTALAVTDPDKQIRISFRIARNHWNLPAYALISLPAPIQNK